MPLSSSAIEGVMGYVPATLSAVYAQLKVTVPTLSPDIRPVVSDVYTGAAEPAVMIKLSAVIVREAGEIV